MANSEIITDLKNAIAKEIMQDEAFYYAIDSPKISSVEDRDQLTKYNIFSYNKNPDTITDVTTFLTLMVQIPKTYDKNNTWVMPRLEIWIYSHNDHTNQKQNMEFICNKHKEEGIQNIIYRNFKYKNCGCHFCAKEKFNQIHRIDSKEAKRLTELKGLEFVDIAYGEDHNKHSAIIKFICPRHRYVGIQQTTLGQMKKGLFGCNYCNFVLDTYTMKEKMTERDIPFELVGEFKGNDIRTEFLCKKHLTTFSQKPRKIFEGVCGCPDCHREFLVNNKLLTKEQAQAKLNESFPSLHIVGEYINTFTPVELYCDIHECRFMCSINNYLYKGKSTCCPCDSVFKGEKMIAEYLNKSFINFETRKTYDDLRGVNNGKLSYDFYLNDFNTCIEYNGEQHYRPVDIFGGKKRFKKQLIHDNLKKRYCENNDINLIIVPYWEKENIENFLMDEFKKIHIA